MKSLTPAFTASCASSFWSSSSSSIALAACVRSDSTIWSSWAASAPVIFEAKVSVIAASGWMKPAKLVVAFALAATSLASLVPGMAV